MYIVIYILVRVQSDQLVVRMSTSMHLVRVWRQAASISTGIFSESVKQQSISSIFMGRHSYINERI